MSRWGSKKKYFEYIGRLGDNAEFTELPAGLQTDAMASVVGATRSSDAYFEVCGSLGEVANDPSIGHRYSMFVYGNEDEPTREPDRQTYDLTHGKQMVWTSIALNADDQLRQRVAWALAQIYVIAEDGLGRTMEHEVWFRYYDIFVSNAFGNLRDVLQEARTRPYPPFAPSSLQFCRHEPSALTVTYSPMMGTYLTYQDSESHAKTGDYPDENYAREFMQLFSIGLYKLHLDGTIIFDEASGKRLETYSNQDIMEFAKVFTGFVEQSTRANVERPTVAVNENNIDPMRIRPASHDAFPKMGLDGKHIGDGVPLCEEMPARAFLRKGAVYKFWGTSVARPNANERLDPPLEVSSRTSALRNTLCDAHPETNACRFPRKLVLPDHLTCQGNECVVDKLSSVKVVGPNGEVGFYEHVPMPCVRLSFFQGGVKVQESNALLCANPNLAAAGTSCCGFWVPNQATGRCMFDEELVSYRTANFRCLVNGQAICNPKEEDPAIKVSGCEYNARLFSW
eukprot:6186781-Pleurochrysis_carterae.AAC.1